MDFERIIKQQVVTAIQELYGAEVNEKQVQLQVTRKEIDGDFTLVVFPFLRMSKKSPEQTAEELGALLVNNVEEISAYNVIKGFLNLEIAEKEWIQFSKEAHAQESFGICEVDENSEKVMVEFSSPNTNKPLHLGHIRNILLGDAVTRILKANGKNVKAVNLVNDRGIHICKSMLAWQKWGMDATPESTGIKGDHLVGDYYVKFDQEYKKEIRQLVESGIEEKIAKKEASILGEAQAMLRSWEHKEPEIYQLWEKMNAWVYDGFELTYNQMGIEFDKTYYESDTFSLGKKLVLEGLEKGILIRKEDGSVWADLTKDKLDEKILLRSDGTSVYMTQDLGTAHQRFEDFDLDRHIYVVGNEQNYHFQVLKIVLKKLGFDWAEHLFHLSYGMVELPTGKMKSREGTVVDADDLISEMIVTARSTSEELGKLEGLSEEEIVRTMEIIALGALKYFILKVDPKKTMTFVPEESIDFNGNTGPFIQYTYARIQSVLRKAEANGFDKTIDADLADLEEKELALLKSVYSFPAIVREAGENLSPALIANYVYELTREFNQFYHDISILKEDNKALRSFRIALSELCANVIRTAMSLLGADVPERM
jgi:arginyl-tRNA synthetase